MHKYLKILLLHCAFFVATPISFAQTHIDPIREKITHVRGTFQGDCYSLYVFDGFDATFDSLNHNFIFRVSGGYKGKYLGSYECIIPFAKVDSIVVSRVQTDDCVKKYLPKQAIFRAELRFKDENISLRSYGSPLPENFDQIYLYFFSAFEAYDFEKTIKSIR